VTPDHKNVEDRLRVLINLTWLVPGVVGGSEEATTAALRAVATDPPEDLQIQLAVLEPFLSAHAGLAAAFPHHVLRLDGGNKLRRVFAEQTWLARLARRTDARVVHHAGGVVPLAHPGRVVLTIHDLQPLDLARNFSSAKRLYIRAMAQRSARVAQVICVPSEFTASRVVALLGVDPARIRVVPWCVPPRRVAHLPEAAGQIQGDPRGGRGISERYFLYPAVTYAHKNHLMLLDAFALVARQVPKVDLVLTGAAGPLEAAVMARVKQLELESRVHRTGRIGADELEELYAGAAAVLVPSRYEGFGLPALEAMVRGCLVLGSNCGSLPEVLRAEDLLDPDDAMSWAGAMQSVLNVNGSGRAARVAAGTALASAFTPARTAAALLDAYRLAGAKGGRK
jgi:glycosyltransferase involved in cell wall biosynthesis